MDLSLIKNPTSKAWDMENWVKTIKMSFQNSNKSKWLINTKKIKEFNKANAYHLVVSKLNHKNPKLTQVSHQKSQNYSQKMKMEDINIRDSKKLVWSKLGQYSGLRLIWPPWEQEKVIILSGGHINQSVEFWPQTSLKCILDHFRKMKKFGPKFSTENFQISENLLNSPRKSGHIKLSLVILSEVWSD